MTLSQDEINALLNGGLSGDADENSEEVAAEETEVAAEASSETELPTELPVEEPLTDDVLDGLVLDNLSSESSSDPQDSAATEEAGDFDLGDYLPEEEPIMASDIETSDAGGEPAATDEIDPSRVLTPKEIDLLGEVGNICMGAVATTMYTLLDRRVNITTPRVSVHTTEEVLREYKTPFVVVEVQYVEGIYGKNMLMLKDRDAALITDLLMGGEGVVQDPVELNELHMSAISEIMNQMIGASATALSKIVGYAVNISPPKSTYVQELRDASSEMLGEEDLVVKNSFDMEIEGLLKSELLQLLPYELGRDLAKKLYDAETAQAAEMEAAKAAEAAPAPPPAPEVAPPPAAPPVQQAAPAQPAMDPYAQQAYAQPPSGYAPPPPPPQPGQLVDVRPMQYSSFDQNQPQPVPTSDMNLIQDIPLTVSVELGKAKREISEVLNFGNGTVIVLDKLAGEPVEIIVNGKLVARGEVVVIEENYGVRITEIVNNSRF